MKSNTEDRNDRTDKTSSESGSYLVCAGATCSCSEALIPVPVKLKITSQQKIFINDSQLVATVQDNNMDIAVAPFVQCKQSQKTGKPCEYTPSSSWEWSPDVGNIHPEIKGMKILTENAFLKCPIIPAAKITIVTHGQIIDVADDAIEELDEPIALAILCLYEKIEKQPENNTIPRVQSIQVGAYKSKQGPVVSVPIRIKSQYVFTANYGNDALYCYWYLKPKKENEKIPLKYDPAEGLLYKQIGNKIALQINEEGNYYIEGFGQLLIKNKSKERMFADCTLLLEAQKNTFKKIKISPAPIQKAQADKIEVWYSQSYTIGLETLFELSDSEKETLSISIEDSDRNLIKQYAYGQAIPSADDPVIGSAEQINVLDMEEKIAEDHQPIPIETPFLIDGISSFKLSNLNEGIYYVRVNILDEPEKEYTFYAVANKLEKAIKSADIPSSHQIRPNTKVKLEAKLMNANDKKKVTWYINNIKQENQQDTALTYSFSSLGKHKIYASLLQFGLLRSTTDVYTVEVLNNDVKAVTTAPAKKEYPVGTTLEFKAETVFAKILAEKNEEIAWTLACTKEGARIKGTGAVRIISKLQSKLRLPDEYIQFADIKNTENTLKIKFNQVGEFELRAAIGKSKGIKALPIKIIYAHIEAWKFVDAQQQARKNVGWGQSFAIYLKVKGWEGKSISLQLWYDNRSKYTKSRFIKVDCDVLKNKQVVKDDGSCHVQIEGDSFWKSFEKAISWENKDFRFFFTAFDVDSICDNSNAKTEETLPGHIFPKAVANTYAHIPNKTLYKGHFVNSDGSLLTDIIEYKDQAKIVIYIENKKGDAFLENKYLLYLHENRTGEDPKPLVTEQKFNKEGKIEYPIPMDVLKSTKEKAHPKHRPRFFYFRLELVGGRFSWDKFVCTYPEDYGIDRKNDAHIIDLTKDDYKPEEMPAPLWWTPIIFDRVDKIWPENLRPFELKKKEEEERAVATQQQKPSDDQKRQAETKNKKAKEENLAKIERGKNYHYQLKIAEDADLQRSRYSNTGKRIGKAIGGEGSNCGGKFCITRQNYKSYKFGSKENVGKLIQEINIRLAGFGGNVPTKEFDERTENTIKQFQRDYMGITPTGKICGSLLKAIDKFCRDEKYNFNFSQLKCKCSTKNTTTRDILLKKDVVNKCCGWGDESNKTGIHSKYYEHPGIHRSLLFMLRATIFYLEKDKTDFSISYISSGYRCRFHEEFLKRATYNHMGTAIDLHFYSKKLKERTKSSSDMDWIRKEIFSKYMNAPYFPKEVHAKFGWNTDEIGLEPARFRDGTIGANTWVHIDVREFKNYKDDDFFVKEENLLNKEMLSSMTNRLMLSFMCSCAGHLNAANLYSNKNKLFTIQDGKEALRIIYQKYGKDMAIIVERMYRCETTHFTSGQYQNCGTPGMEVATGKEKLQPYYGWGSLSTFCKTNTEFYTEGTWSAMEGEGLSKQGGNKQDTQNAKTFVKMNSVLGGMEFLVNYINNRDGNYAIWYAGSNQDNQKRYQDKLKTIRARFVEEFENKKL